jgi:hypothetical protein
MTKIDPIRQFREKRQAQRDAADADARDRYNEQQRVRALRAFTAAGGDDEGFEAEWPEIHKTLLRDETIQTLRGDNQ